jgi:hypothetical protein
MAVNEAVDAERAGLDARDPLEPPAFEDRGLDVIGQHLRSSSRVKSAWIARKQVQHDREFPIIAVAVRLSGMVFSETGLLATIREGLLKTLEEQLDFNGMLFVVSKNGDHQRIAKAIRKKGVKLF